VHIEDREAAVIRVAGRSCARCNEQYQAAGHTTKRSRVTMMMAQRDGERARIESLHENVQDKSASYLEPTFVAAPRARVSSEKSRRADEVWRERVSPVVGDVLAEPDRQLLEESWQPESCEVLDAVAEALGDVWRVIVPGSMETEVVLRIVGYSPAVAALIVITVERTVLGGSGPGGGPGEMLRFTGIAICAITGNISACHCVRVQMKLTGADARQVLARLTGDWVPALTATDEAPTVSRLFEGLDTVRAGVRVPLPVPDDTGTVPAQPEAGLIPADLDPVADMTPDGSAAGPGSGRGVSGGAVSHSIISTQRGLDGPSSTTTFGTP
jgi:hypothetical protein